MPARVTRERVRTEQDRVREKDQRAEAHSEPVFEEEGPDAVDEQDDREDEGGIEEVAVDVLKDQRETRLTRVLFVRLGHSTRRRREPEGAVVRLAVVVAGQPEAEGEGEDQQRRRQRPPVADYGE